MNKLKLIVVVFVAAAIFSSCKKSFFYDGINNDPSSVTVDQLTPAPNVLLNGAELNTGYTVGGDVSRYTAMFVNSVQGYNRQFATYQNYIFTADDFSNVWSNFYQGNLNNLYKLKNLATENGYNHYAGVANVLLAYNFGLASDLWGDVPRTNALQGDQGNVKPTYDKQQDIYPYLQTILDSAITQLSGSAGAKAPGDDDFIYGGDVDKWIGFAHALKARYYLHLSKVDNSYATNALASINAALSGGAESALVPFFDNETQSNPWYQYIQQRSDISYKDAFLANTLRTMNDTRLAAYINETDDVLTDLFAGIDAPVTLMSKTEMLFIQAEALSATNDPAAATVYADAITSSFADAGIPVPPGYLTTNALVGADHAARLPQIILQKYLALYTQSEPFSDWRRTGYPALVPNNGSNIPRRFLYSQNENDFNGANVPTGTTLFSHVWWDQ